MSLKKNLLWILYFSFAAFAVMSNWHAQMLSFSGPAGLAKAFLWLTLLGFLAYSLYASSQENIVKIMRTMKASFWGRQIGIDLYLGLLIILSLIYLNEGSIWIVLLWILPILIFANLATLLYLAIHFDQILARFY